MVPVIYASSAMMFLAVPACIVPMVITAGLLASSSRLAIVCRFITMAEAATMASTAWWGIPPWPPWPLTLMLRLAEAAILPPASTQILPTGIWLSTWTPMMASQSSKSPFAIMARAPLGKYSSAGWKMSFTVPASWSRHSFRAFAVASRDAVWASWPQACITPSFWER